MPSDKPYRPNVGIALFNAAGRVTPLDANHLYAWEMAGSSSPMKA